MESPSKQARSLRSRWWLAAAAVVAAMLVLILERKTNLPNNTGTLSDGSVITLVQLGTGPHHEYFDTRQASTWERLLYRLVPRRIRHEVGVDVHEVSFKAYPDALSIWLKRRSMTAMPGVIRFRVRDDQGNYATSSGYQNMTAKGGNVLVTLMRHFPRRAASLTIELEEQNSSNQTWMPVAVWHVANPKRISRLPAIALVTNQSFHGFEMTAVEARVAVGTNRFGVMGSVGSFEFAVTKDGQPRGDWVLKDFAVQDATGNRLVHPEQGIFNDSGKHRWTLWGDYHTREAPFRLQILLEPHQFAPSNLVGSLQTVWTVTNTFNTPGSFTNYPGAFDAFGQQLTLSAYPTGRGIERRLVLETDADLSNLVIALEQIVDQNGNDLKAEGSFREDGQIQTFTCSPTTNSTSYVATFRIQSLVEVNFVVEPEFDLPLTERK